MNFKVYEIYVHTHIVGVHDYGWYLKPQNNVCLGNTNCPLLHHLLDDILFCIGQNRLGIQT